MMGEGQHGPGPLACACRWACGPSLHRGSYISILSTEEQIAMLKKDTRQEKAQNGTNGRKTKKMRKKGYKKKSANRKKMRNTENKGAQWKNKHKTKKTVQDRKKKKGAKQKKQAQNGKKKAQNGKQGAKRKKRRKPTRL
jgi:hypothetical protein